MESVSIGQASLEDLSAEWSRRVHKKQSEIKSAFAVLAEREYSVKVLQETVMKHQSQIESSLAELVVRENLVRALEEKVMKKLTELAERERSVKAFEEKVMGVIGNDADIIDINAGGAFHSVSRSTLCAAEGSVFAALFSGRWDHSVKHDSSGRIFLDVDPYCFDKIICLMRLKRLQGPGEQLQFPKVESDKQQIWEKLLDYYGLQEVLSANKDLMCLSPVWTCHPSTVSLGSYSRGYVVRFASPFKLAAVYVGLAGNAEGCVIHVGDRSQRGMRSIPVIAASHAADAHVTHAAQNFELMVHPPECVIIVQGSSNAQIKYQDVGDNARLTFRSVGTMSVQGISEINKAIQENSYHIPMVIEIQKS